VHFLFLEPRETDKIVLKFCKHCVVKFHFLLLGALIMQSNTQYQYAGMLTLVTFILVTDYFLGN